MNPFLTQSSVDPSCTYFSKLFILSSFLLSLYFPDSSSLQENLSPLAVFRSSYHTMIPTTRSKHSSIARLTPNAKYPLVLSILNAVHTLDEIPLPVTLIYRNFTISTLSALTRENQSGDPLPRIMKIPLQLKENRKLVKLYLPSSPPMSKSIEQAFITDSTNVREWRCSLVDNFFCSFFFFFVRLFFFL